MRIKYSAQTITIKITIIVEDFSRAKRFFILFKVFALSPCYTLIAYFYLGFDIMFVFKRKESKCVGGDHIRRECYLLRVMMMMMMMTGE